MAMIKQTPTTTTSKHSLIAQLAPPTSRLLLPNWSEACLIGQLAHTFAKIVHTTTDWSRFFLNNFIFG